MSDPSKSAIARLIEQLDGPTAVSALLENTPVYQEIQRWVKRGWAAPKHFLRLEALAKSKKIKVTVRDLYADIERAKAPEAETAPRAEPAPAAADEPAADPLQQRRDPAVEQLERALGIKPPRRRFTDSGKPNASDRERGGR
jgi:hypothetical protein